MPRAFALRLSKAAQSLTSWKLYSFFYTYHSFIGNYLYKVFYRDYHKFSKNVMKRIFREVYTEPTKQSVAYHHLPFFLCFSSSCFVFLSNSRTTFFTSSTPFFVSGMPQEFPTPIIMIFSFFFDLRTA